MEQTVNFDFMNIANKKNIIEKLKKDEYIIFSAMVDKFNNVNKVYERILLATNLGIYNLED